MVFQFYTDKYVLADDILTGTYNNVKLVDKIDALNLKLYRDPMNTDNMLLEIKDISQLQALLSDFGCPVEMLTPFESYNSLCIHDGGDK